MNHPALCDAIYLAAWYIDGAHEKLQEALDRADLDDVAELHHIVDLDKLKHTADRLRGMLEPVS